MSDLLKQLNPAQREAVTGYDHPSLIIAGAGSGKTRVLTSRIAYMLQQGVPAHRILALTFTNKAAREMRERISTMVPPGQSERLWMGTFHSLFLRILRMEADKLGYNSSFTIYDTSDSRNLIKAIVKDMNLSDDYYKPAALQSRISLAKNNLVTCDAYQANSVYITEDRQRKIPKFADVYREYQRRCRENSAMDFDDMLLNINILFRDFPDALEKYQQRFQYILVDEYQDTNYAQYIIIRRLAQLHSRVCVVGDDAQSIYSFRGAKIENILRFRNDFPQAKTYKLEQNYRSTKTIVNAANSVIEKNRNRLEKESFSAGEKGDNIKVIKAYTDQEEVAVVADEIRRIVRTCDAGWNDIALLYRTNMQSRVFEEAFRKRGIPYRIYGGMSFYQRKEIKDLLAYMHLIVNPRDDEAFKRVINFPARGIGAVTIGKITSAAAQKGLSSMELIESCDLKEVGLNTGTAARVKDFAALINSFRENTASMKLYELGLDVATRSGIIGGYKIEQTPEAQSALDNIEELLNSLHTFQEQEQLSYQEEDPDYDEPGLPVEPTLSDWLQSITLLTDMDEQTGEESYVTLMTIHAAKGLEFRFVFVVGLEENLFPSSMSMDAEEGLEEERRLFYVALTRAKEAAMLTFSETRFKWGSMQFCQPSRFLSEIDPQYLDISFDLDEKKRAESPSATALRNYRERSSDNTASNNGYGQGETVRGWKAERYKSSTGTSGSASATTPSVNPVSVGSNFRSIGTRPANSPSQAQNVPAGAYNIGQHVVHSKFGEGEIIDIEETSMDKKITVVFLQHGKKTLLSKYARLQILD